MTWIVIDFQRIFVIRLPFYIISLSRLDSDVTLVVRELIIITAIFDGTVLKNGMLLCHTEKIDFKSITL